MTEKKDIATQKSKTMQEVQEQERSIRPAVDIFEDDAGITLHADMPGVAKERLDIQIDGESLSITGDLDIPVADNVHAVYADVRSNRYQRSFSLSRELDTSNVDASLKDGVLIMRIPKREEHKPRKIEVHAD
jgi:HSP20 family molecular chaperone IbpA